MAQKLIAPLAPGLVLIDGYIVRVTALSPTTGAVVSGVTVSNVAMQVDTIDPEDAQGQDQLTVPLFTYGGG